MCRNCLKEIAPDRGSSCLEKGSYLLNFSGCSQCKTLAPTADIDRMEETSDDGEESITYTHTCSECGHVIAEHCYTFSVSDGYQEYSMNCDLCGIGEASVSILPGDPMKNMLF